MPISGVDLSVVIPVYNNTATLDELLDRIITVVESMGLAFEVILVDDGSRDASLALLRARAARDPRIRVFALMRNFGSQSAVCAGFDQVRGRLAMCMDADLENLPEDIPALLEPLERGYDLACGYREERRSPWLTRRVPSLLLNAYVRRQTGVYIRDVGCGMRGFKAWVVKDLESEGEARRLLTPVFLRRAHRVIEVPLRHGPARAPGGHSFLTLLGIAVDYYMLTARRPFIVSGLVAGGATVAGMALLAAGADTRGLVLTCAGLVGGLLSLVGEYCQRLYQLGRGVPFYKLRDLDGDGEESAE